jgi:hypothetical protein
LTEEAEMTDVKAMS